MRSDPSSRIAKSLHGLVSVPQQDLTELQEDLATCGRPVSVQYFIGSVK